MKKVLILLFLSIVIISSKVTPMDLSISEQLAYSTVRIEVEYSDKKTGSGTGFFFKLLDKGDSHIPVIVTNKHVVKNTIKGRFVLTLKDNNGVPIDKLHKTIEMNNFENRWIQHPDSLIDLCIMPIAPLLAEANKMGINFFYIALDKSLIPSDKEMLEYNYVEDILMVGYPIGISDQYNNLPVFRRGITATHPGNDYENKQEFMIDAACFPGSSGSPVILYNVPYYTDKKGNTIFQKRVKLLGILYAGPQYTAEGSIVIKNVPTNNIPVVMSQIPTNLGLVIKSSKILDFEPILEKLQK